MELVTVNNVGWDLKAPCGDCPFLKTSPFHEGVAGSISSYVESIQSGVFAHTCHKTDNREACDGPKNYKGERPQHCVGAIMMLLKTGHTLDYQMPLLHAAERGEIDLKAMHEAATANENVFTVGQLLKFYADELAKQLKTPRMKAALRRAKRKAAKRR